MYNKIFISTVNEDSKTAENLFDFLVLYKYNPWLYFKNLLPGQQWDYEIRRELKKSDFIILLFSKTSVYRRGYIQREFRLALEYCEERLDTDIFIIPCKIDDCEMPDPFKKFQWIDLRNPDSLGRLLGALNSQRKKYMNGDDDNISPSGKLKGIPDEEAVDSTLERRMEYCTPLNPDIVKPQYTVISNNNNHIINLINVDTKEIFPIWKHPKLSSYSEQIINFGLDPDVWEDGDGVVWINTLVFDIEPYNVIIDVHGPWDNGKRYSGILHLDEDWSCSYEMAGKLGLFA